MLADIEIICGEEIATKAVYKLEIFSGVSACGTQFKDPSNVRIREIELENLPNIVSMFAFDVELLVNRCLMFPT